MNPSWNNDRKMLELLGSWTRRLVWVFVVFIGVGLIFCLMAAIGGGIAKIAHDRFDAPHGEIVTDVALLDLRGVNPADSVGPICCLTADDDTQRIDRISVFTTVREPSDGAATIIIYEYLNGDEGEPLGRLVSHAGSWSRWDQKVTRDQRIAVAIEGAPAGMGAPATCVDVLVFGDEQPVAVSATTLPPATFATATPTTTACAAAAP
jgi:hypothetical protein